MSGTQVTICCGVGGTGKTTTSAALALAYALSGQRVVVLTIDPARRLADALGIGTLDNMPRRVPLEGAAGTLDALMLDRAATWDEVVRRRATPETAERLLENRYYRAVSTRLTGSHEYMAVEKLHALATHGGYDHVIVDTPPTQHVVDFFRAPDRVRGILDRSMLRLLIDPGTSLRGVAARGALSIVERLAGERVMGEIREFFSLIGEMSAGFRERSEEVATLLRSGRTVYWLVTEADAPERNDLLGFLGELRERGMRFGGFLMNRVQPEVPLGMPAADALERAIAGLAGADEALRALYALPEHARTRAAGHERAARRLCLEGGAPVWTVPELAGGVRSLEGLAALTPHLPPAAEPSYRSGTATWR
ncbi:MAG: AAA family ATPase [Alphaproteobacteria bacterium]|nr:AAA family ATPase [Alphaproteobacteria bacterium]